MIANKYRKKPVVIEAIKTDGTWTTYKEVCKFVGHELQVNQNGLGIADELIIPTLEGEMIASKGDYIIKGIKGEFYPCKPEIFESSFEKAEEPSEIEKKYGADLNNHPVNLAYYGIV